LLSANQLQLAFQLPTIYNQFAPSTTTSNGIQIACNLKFVALCLQFELAFKSPTIYNQTCFQPNYFKWHVHCPQLCIPLLFAYNFNWHSNCLQLTINLLFAALQLQLAYTLPAICNPLLFDYNFNWHSNCLPFIINLLFAKPLQLAFKLPAICNPLLLPTTSTGVPTACNLHSIALCLQLPTLFKGPQFAIRLLLAYKYY